MVATDRPKGTVSLGFESGQIVQEFGYDEDVDHGLRDEIEAMTGESLADEDYDDVCDGVVVWWREGDGDLTDMLVDAISALESAGAVWVLTPKPGRDGHVAPGDVEDSAKIAGLHATSSIAVAPDWCGIRLLSRGRSM